jgi:hypothetical protein
MNASLPVTSQIDSRQVCPLSCRKRCIPTSGVPFPWSRRAMTVQAMLGIVSEI